MTHYTLPRLAIAAILLTACQLLSLAKTDPPATAQPAGAGDDIVYRPPPGTIDAAGMRVISHSVRGSNDDAPTFFILAPDHVAWTVNEQPSIFWFLSKPTAKPFVLTLSQKDRPEPLLKVKLDGNLPGIHRLDLASQNVKLRVGVQYHISMVLVMNGAPGANDRSCSAYIQRVDPSDDLKTSLDSRSDNLDRAKVLASHYVWYDALAMVCGEIENDPGNHPSQLQLCLTQRNKLLNYVRLDSFIASSKDGLATGK